MRAGSTAAALQRQRVARYRMLKPFPEVLEYRNARVFIRSSVSIYNIHSWLAVKDAERYSSVQLIQCANAEGLEHLRTQGFDVSDGSPADRIMQALVARGYAVAEHSNSI